MGFAEDYDAASGPGVLRGGASAGIAAAKTPSIRIFHISAVV
jgi:hypothetical protein